MKIKTTYLGKDYFYIQKKNLVLIRETNEEDFVRLRLQKYIKKNQRDETFVKVEEKCVIDYLDQKQHFLNYMNVKDASYKELNQIYNCLWKEKTESFQDTENTSLSRIMNMMPYLDELSFLIDKPLSFVEALPPIPYEGSKTIQDAFLKCTIQETLNPFVFLMEKEKEVSMPTLEELSTLVSFLLKEKVEERNKQLTVSIREQEADTNYLLSVEFCKRKTKFSSFFKKSSQK